ncbi:MAG: hypothetical protein JJT88_15400 [Gammaproteobacteria bacterium]|nr:hypothetical protein [Gammaproteobacteria bacterium]
MKMKSALTLTLLIIPGIFGTIPAMATPLTWTLQNFSFTDGGIATGSFTYDAINNIYTDILITTSGGGIGGSTYLANPSGNCCSPSTLLVATTTEQIQPGDQVLTMTFAGQPLTNEPGVVPLLTFAEGTCLTLTETDRGNSCSQVLVQRLGLAAQASVFSEAVAVPAPATLPLLLYGLLALRFLRVLRPTCGVRLARNDTTV